MDEVVEVLQGILYEMKEMNSKLENINDSVNSLKGDGLYDSISDVYNKLEELMGQGLYNSISDLSEKLDNFMGRGLYNSISDVNEKLDSISSSVSSIELNTM